MTIWRRPVVQVDHGSTPQFAKGMGGSIAVMSFAQREDRQAWRDIARRQQLKFRARCYGHLGSLSSGARAVDDGIALAETSVAASRPSINGEQPKSGIPSRRKVRSSSMPRESANVNPCRLRHTRLDAPAVATICRVSATHAPINFPSRPIDTSVICTGCVMSSNLGTSACW